jgi:hypothetical protein
VNKMLKRLISTTMPRALEPRLWGSSARPPAARASIVDN